MSKLNKDEVKEPQIFDSFDQFLLSLSPNARISHSSENGNHNDESMNIIASTEGESKMSKQTTDIDLFDLKQTIRS